MFWARLWGRGDDGGGASAVVDPSLGAASAGVGSRDAGGTASLDALKLQLTLWEQWV